MSSRTAEPAEVGAGSAPLAYFLLVTASLCMASNLIFGRAAVGVVPPLTLAFWRWAVAALVLLPFAWGGLRRHRKAILAHWKPLLLAGSLGMGVSGAFPYLGLQTTTVTNGGLIYTMSPVFILIIAASVMGERLYARQWLGVVLAIVGVVVILTQGDPAALLELRFVVGDLWILGATLSWAVYSVMLRRYGGIAPTIPLFAAISGFGAAALLPGFLAETAVAGLPPLTIGAVSSILAVALIASVLAFSTYQKGIALVGPGRAGLFLYLMPVWSALLGVLVLGEAFRMFHLAGFALVLPGIALATRRMR